jgi:hypothetical protein
LQLDASVGSLPVAVVYVRVLKIQNRQQEAELAEVTQELQGLREDKRFLLAKSSHA